MSDLRAAAQAVLDRWDSPRWEWHQGPTAALMADLRAALAEPVQEPVAWAVYDIKHGGSKTLHWPEQHSPNGDPSQFKAVPLYSAPPQRKPLTEEEIKACEQQAMVNGALPFEQRVFFARAIERAHGIGGNDE